MPGENDGRWAIIETKGDYFQHTSIRCFFENEEAAQERWDSYGESEQQNKKLRFVQYGHVFSF